MESMLMNHMTKNYGHQRKWVQVERFNGVFGRVVGPAVLRQESAALSCAKTVLRISAVNDKDMGRRLWHVMLDFAASCSDGSGSHYGAPVSDETFHKWGKTAGNLCLRCYSATTGHQPEEARRESLLRLQLDEHDDADYILVKVEAISQITPVLVYWNMMMGLSNTKGLRRYEHPQCLALSMTDLPTAGQWYAGSFGDKPSSKCPAPHQVHQRTLETIDDPEGKVSNKGAPLKIYVTTWHTLDWRTAVNERLVFPDDGATDRWYEDTFLSRNVQEKMKNFREQYPMPQNGFSYWPVAVPTIAQKTYAVSREDKLLSREFTRAVLSKMTLPELEEKYPEEFLTWNRSYENFRAPRVDEERYEQAVDDLLRRIGSKKIAACVMQLVNTTGCTRAEWPLGSTAAWLLENVIDIDDWGEWIDEIVNDSEDEGVGHLAEDIAAMGLEQSAVDETDDAPEQTDDPADPNNENVD